MDTQPVYAFGTDGVVYLISRTLGGVFAQRVGKHQSLKVKWAGKKPSTYGNWKPYDKGFTVKWDKGFEPSV